MSLYSSPTTVAITTLPRKLLLPPAPMDMHRRDMPPPLVVVNRDAKHKAVVVMGATGTGKTRLAVDLALRFNGEVINADKIQIHAGFDVVTNKATAEDRAGVPHHLLGVAHRDADFTAADFRREASRAARGVASRGRLPIVAGGSNSYIQELVVDNRRAFLFLWIDVELAVLDGVVGRRVDEMRRRGLVDEVAAAFDPRRVDYSRGVWRAIGVPELDAYLRAGDEDEELLDVAMEKIKANTRRLARRQRGKIQRLDEMWHGVVRRVDATEVFLRQRDADEAWERLVAAPCTAAVSAFLHDNDTTAAPVLARAAMHGGWCYSRRLSITSNTTRA